MSITRRYGTKQNLGRTRVWVLDEESNSRYFQVSELPEVLTAGKNSFLISGSPELLNLSEVLIEVIAADGTSLYVQPIKNFQLGLARVVTIWVYQDTAVGPATMTILGRLAKDSNGNSVPSEWHNRYNVKWQRRIQVAPNRGNVSPVRLVDTPTVSVSEILNPFRLASIPEITITGSLNFYVTGSVNTPPLHSGSSKPYIVAASTSSFVSAMEGGEFTDIINGSPFTASVTTVYNNRMIQLTPGYVVSGAYTPFVSNTFTIKYNGDPLYEPTQYTRSFADMTISQLSTFSGDIYRVKVYVSSVDSPGYQELITDARVEAPEMMQTSSFATGKQRFRTGKFVDQSIPDNYWVIGLISSEGYVEDSSLQLVYNSDILIDAVKPFGEFMTLVSSNEYEDPQLFFGPRNSYTFEANAEYTLAFSTSVIKQTANIEAKMEVYLVGSAFPKEDSFGKLIATYISNRGVLYQPFALKEWNFDGLKDGIGYLRFVVYSGTWNVSNVSLKPASEFGFTPDSVELLIPIVGHQQEHLIFSVELYDINNNLVAI